MTERTRVVCDVYDISGVKWVNVKNQYVICVHCSLFSLLEMYWMILGLYYLLSVLRAQYLFYIFSLTMHISDNYTK